MNKLLSLYKWFDVVELIIGLIGVIGSTASVYGLWYAIINRIDVPLTYIIGFIVVIVLSICYILTKLYKFKVQCSQHLSIFCSNTHEICHEMRDKFFDLFDHWKASGGSAMHPTVKKGFLKQLSNYKNQIAESGSRLLSDTIHLATGCNVTVVIKTFDTFDTNNLKDGPDLNKEQLRSLIMESGLELKTDIINYNGKKNLKLPLPVNIKNHSLYAFAIADILIDNDGVFIAPNTKKFIKLASRKVSKFITPDGTLEKVRIKGNRYRILNSD